MQPSVYQIVTFATHPFAGNPAFVVVVDRPYPGPTMQALCSQLREPILATLFAAADAIHLDYWTPGGTHPGPGHSTHAAAWVVFNRLRRDASEVDLLLAGGGTRTVRQEADGRLSVDWPTMSFAAVNEIAGLADALGHRPLETFDSPFGIVAVLDDDRDVASLRPDLDRIAKLDGNTVIVTSPARDADFAIRVFAPKVGLPEDPICGTAHRILVPFWADRLKRKELVSHQLSPRGGRLYCRLGGETVTIGGEATLFIEGAIALPPD